MGYTTEFSGQIECTPPLNEQEKTFLNAFSQTRRVIRQKAKPTDGLVFIDGEDTGELLQGSYFIAQQKDDYYGQNTKNIAEHNSSPLSSPGLWCQWIANEEGHIEWNCAEKFYSSAEWMAYLIENFLKEGAPCKFVAPKTFEHFQPHTLNGVIYATGEETGDIWKLIVQNNQVFIQELEEGVAHDIYQTLILEHHPDIEIFDSEENYTDEYYDALYDIKHEIDLGLIEDDKWKSLEKINLFKTDEEMQELELLQRKFEQSLLDKSLTKTVSEGVLLKI